MVVPQLILFSELVELRMKHTLYLHPHPWREENGKVAWEW